MKIESYIDIENTKDGQVIDRIRRPSKTFVKNLYNFYITHLLGITPSEANDLDCRQTSGVSINYLMTGSITANETAALFWRGNESIVANTGILCGSGDTAENFGMGASPNAMSYRLDSIILHGTTAGTLERASQDAPVITQTGAGPVTWDILWRRYFNNKSGGSVVVKEIGVYFYYSTSYSVMVTRDVLDSSITVLDTGQLKVDYTLTIELPA